MRADIRSTRCPAIRTRKAYDHEVKMIRYTSSVERTGRKVCPKCGKEVTVLQMVDAKGNPDSAWFYERHEA